MKRLLLAAVAAIALASCGVDDPSRNLKAEDAAEISDNVAIKSASTIMCSDQNESSRIYMAGEFAFQDEMRLTNNRVWKSLTARDEARKLTMRTAYSCRFAPSSYAGVDVRYDVTKKMIIGTEKDMFHVVIYCLQPTNQNTCWWIHQEFGMSSPFDKVQRAIKTEIAGR
jgi:hypothetical protein